jgi:hypothetical protein
MCRRFHCLSEAMLTPTAWTSPVDCHRRHGPDVCGPNWPTRTPRAVIGASKLIVGGSTTWICHSIPTTKLCQGLKVGDGFGCPYHSRRPSRRPSLFKYLALDTPRFLPEGLWCGPLRPLHFMQYAVCTSRGRLGGALFRTVASHDHPSTALRALVAPRTHRSHPSR